MSPNLIASTGSVIIAVRKSSGGDFMRKLLMAVAAAVGLTPAAGRAQHHEHEHESGEVHSHRGPGPHFIDASYTENAYLESLLTRYTPWIHALALRMVWDREDARDVTQEILLKVITRLGSFRGESSFRTWLYRVTANHVLNMRHRRAEQAVTSFDAYGARINACPDEDLPDLGGAPIPPEILVEEAKSACLTGMLLCLSREQRLVLVLGGILGLDAATAAAVMETTPGDFRQLLSRARRDLKSFMDGQCGLVNRDNPCRCAKKTRAFVRAGVVDPAHLRFRPAHVERLRSELNERQEQLERWVALFQEAEPVAPEDAIPVVREAITSVVLRASLDLDDSPGRA